MKHSDDIKWLFIGLIAVIFLLAFSISVQKPQLISKIPFFAPSPTPTPLASQNIILYSPRINDQISQKFLVKGKARVFENVVSIRFKEKLTGKIIGQTQTMTDSKEAGLFGNFEANIILDNPTLRPATEYILEIYQVSPRDGRDTDKIVVPVRFSPTVE